MDQSSDERLAIARTAYSALLRRLQAEVSQTEAARVIGVNKSTVSRLVNEHAEHLLAVMALAGLKVVDASERTISEEDLFILRRLADRGWQSFGPSASSKAAPDA